MSKTPNSPRPGRRPAQTSTDSRAHLLAAARREFAQHGFRGTTVRQIAARAGVTPAMVHYHFTDKRGLYRAMLEETVGPLLARLQHLAADGGPGSLEDALAGYMRMLAGAPEIPALVMRDVLAADGAMRDTFIRDFAARGAGAMRRILERDKNAGRLRTDLEPRFALLSLISMAVFPFIARPVAAKVLELEYDAAMVDALAAHTARLFYDGVRQTESSR